LKGNPVNHLQKAVDSLYRGIKPLSTVVNAIGMAAMAVMMVFVAADVTLRKLANMPILGSIELTQFMLAICASFGLAQCAVNKGHVVIDMVISRLPRRTRGLLGIGTGILGVGVGALMTWQLINYVLITVKANNVTGVLYIPIWPVVALVTFGFALYCVVLIIHFLEFIVQGSGK
jgi:TRAP-type C4-dicarboxylate transport system permease small subunit